MKQANTLPCWLQWHPISLYNKTGLRDWKNTGNLPVCAGHEALYEIAYSSKINLESSVKQRQIRKNTAENVCAGQVDKTLDSKTDGLIQVK